MSQKKPRPVIERGFYLKNYSSLAFELGQVAFVESFFKVRIRVAFPSALRTG